jgi:hypothetical protein
MCSCFNSTELSPSFLELNTKNMNQQIQISAFVLFVFVLLACWKNLAGQRQPRGSLSIINIKSTN